MKYWLYGCALWEILWFLHNITQVDIFLNGKVPCLQCETSFQSPQTRNNIQVRFLCERDNYNKMYEKCMRSVFQNPTINYVTSKNVNVRYVLLI